MKIENGKRYNVTKYFGEQVSDIGVLPGEDVKRLLKGYAWDATFEMFFSPKANVGYDVQEVA